MKARETIDKIRAILADFYENEEYPKETPEVSECEHLNPKKAEGDKNGRHWIGQFCTCGAARFYNEKLNGWSAWSKK